MAVSALTLTGPAAVHIWTGSREQRAVRGRGPTPDRCSNTLLGCFSLICQLQKQNMDTSGLRRGVVLWVSLEFKPVRNKGGSAPEADEWQSGGGATLNRNPYPYRARARARARRGRSSPACSCCMLSPSLGRTNAVTAGGRRMKEEEQAAAGEGGPPSTPPRFHWPHSSPDASAFSAVARGNHAAASQPVHQRPRHDSASTHPPLSLSLSLPS